MADGSQTDSTEPCTTLVLAEPPHIRRFKGIVSHLSEFVAAGPDRNLARMSFLMDTLAEELGEELKEMDEMQVRLFMFQIGQVISWIGHGDNERLPEFVRPFGETIQPTVGYADDNDSTAAGSPGELDTGSG